MDLSGYVSLRLIMAFVFGTAFFGVLPVFVPPVVLQYEQVPFLLLGLCACAVAGAALVRIAGGSTRLGLIVVGASVLMGIVLHILSYAIPAYGLSDAPVPAWLSLLAITVAYLGFPAAIGAALAGPASAPISRAGGRREGER